MDPMARRASIKKEKEVLFLGAVKALAREVDVNETVVRRICVRDYPILVRLAAE